MYIRKCRQRKDGKVREYWQLVESYRTERGPRQRVVAYLGAVEESARLGVRQAATGEQAHQKRLFGEVQPEWVEVDTRRMRVERVREFGGPWLGQKMLVMLGIPELLDSLMGHGREEIEWPVMAQVLVLAHLCDPSSELRVAEHVYEQTALVDLLGVPCEKVNDDRLYRALDMLLPHKSELEKHLKEWLGELFDLEYDILLYDITSTYFEGECGKNEQAQRGYSRDHRPDCKQVCIGLVVSKTGMPLGYEVFCGNRSDVTTVDEIVKVIEEKYGASDRIWVMDRGMVSQENIEHLRSGNRRYILGTPKSQLKAFEKQLLDDGWESIREGLEVKLCPSPDGCETFILCRSKDRQEKEKAIHERFEKRIEEGLERIAESCRKKKQKPAEIERKIGKLLGRNTRAEGLFKVDVRTREDGGAEVAWSKTETWREWSKLSEGCYALRSNITDWSAEELWKAYIQLTQAEAAFRIQKQDLSVRPVWHQKKERVQAHILVCFLAYVLWKTLGQLCRKADLGDEPRRVFAELSQIRTVDVVLPTKSGVEIRRRCVAEPTKHQLILLQHLGLTLPKRLEMRNL